MPLRVRRQERRAEHRVALGDVEGEMVAAGQGLIGRRDVAWLAQEHAEESFHRYQYGLV